jgi:HEAT repeat protein
MVMSSRQNSKIGGNWILIAAAACGLLCSGCKPPTAAAPAPANHNAVGGLEPATPVQPAANHSATSGAAAAAAAPVDNFPDNPVELSKLSSDVHREKIRLIGTVQDLASAKAVSGTFPALDERHRRIEEKLGNRLLTEEVKQQLQRDFQAERDQLRGDYANEYVRVAFIPGAWEHMHPELAPLADMTEIPQDAQGLNREAVRLLTESLDILRQVTDVNKALELSPRYRVATCRIGPILGRLNTALGGSGIREVQSPQVQELRRQRDEEMNRLRMIHGAPVALEHGQRPVAGPVATQVTAAPQQSQSDRIVLELRSQDQRQIINTLNQLPETLPAASHEAIGAEVIRLFDFEPVAGTALEAIKRGWFSPSQIAELKAAIPKFKDRNLHYILYEGISRTPNLDRENIDFLATLFNEEPGKAVSVLRNVGPAAQPAIFPYATSTSVEVRQCVCEALKDIGLAESLPTLEKLAQDPHPGVVSKAKEAIREIGRPISERTHLRQRQ